MARWLLWRRYAHRHVKTREIMGEKEEMGGKFGINKD